MSTPNRLSSSAVAASADGEPPRCEDGANALADPKRATRETTVFMVKDNDANSFCFLRAR
jgi:hypothetical protein